MRIGIDATGLGGPKTGTAVYVAEILSAWNRDRTIDHDFVVFASPKALEHLSTLNLNRRFRFIKAPDNRYVRALWQQRHGLAGREAESGCALGQRIRDTAFEHKTDGSDGP